jgi:uncharacterized membrane protein YdjX (TVP38/TMEM64 family)
MGQWMETIQSAGWMGWLLFVGLYAISCLLFVPGSILTLAAGTVYGFWNGILLVLIGNGVSALLSLWLTRYVLRDRATTYFSRSPKMRALQAAVEKGGWKIVCLSHLSPLMPFSLINYAYGLTNIPAVEFLLATEIGSIPSACIYVYMGTFLGNLAKIGSEIRHPSPLEWLFRGIGLLVTIAITAYISRTASQILKREMR